MPDLTRISISLENALLDAFDRHIDGKGYATRSEAIRDLIRDRLVRDEARTAGGEQVAVPVGDVVQAVQARLAAADQL